MNKAARNERTKLLANALDRASTACVTVGVLAPMAAVLYTGSQPSPWLLGLGVLAWLVVARALHGMAAATLARIEE
ncbi:hypothetical protein EAH89_28230 [Roseomonas nepalensis]|uniref:Uncharacterized protein n=1 Tax=Muricoccus nepalensis TaxID=1854500 RepID=A0A502EWK6_9PROT|nr:hypothetical protein [Roseomonas nepalensis]TPG41937.1 hypothetical protein EAH89_28230 [Roseomonas nepalensis]